VHLQQLQRLAPPDGVGDALAPRRCGACRSVGPRTQRRRCACARVPCAGGLTPIMLRCSCRQRNARRFPIDGETLVSWHAARGRRQRCLPLACRAPEP
jgi:hypothetical protein